MLRQLEHGCSATLTSLCAGTGRPERCVNGEAYNADKRPMPEAALSGNTLQMAIFTDLPPPHEQQTPYTMAAYLGWRQMDIDLLQNSVLAFCFRLVVLWSALGSGERFGCSRPCASARPNAI